MTAHASVDWLVVTVLAALLALVALRFVSRARRMSFDGQLDAERVLESCVAFVALYPGSWLFVDGSTLPLVLWCVVCAVQLVLCCLVVQDVLLRSSVLVWLTRATNLVLAGAIVAMVAMNLVADATFMVALAVFVVGGLAASIQVWRAMMEQRVRRLRVLNQAPYSPGWYPNPERPAELRWFNGYGWSTVTRRQSVWQFDRSDHAQDT